MTKRDDVARLLKEHGETFAEQAGINLADKPSPLFRLLVLTRLLSANLDPALGLRTSRALSEAGYRTARRLAEASDEQRWQVLSESKYLRKKQTARQLGAIAEKTMSDYSGDLRRLRDEYDGDVDGLREALRDFTGIGAVGADIFCREAQTVWPSLRPFVDAHVGELAKARGLPSAAARLADLAGTDDLARLGAALVNADMAARS